VNAPTEAWKLLQHGNQTRCAATKLREKYRPQKSPSAMVFRCADAAPTSASVFGQDPSTIIDVSSWGHVVDAGVLATVEHVIATLNLPLIVVLGHEDCAAVRAALRVWSDGAEMPNSAARVAVEQLTTSILHRCSGSTSADRVEAAHVTEVALALVQRSPLLARAVDIGSCAVVSAVSCGSAGGQLEVCATIGSLDTPRRGLLECV
jgi:carbonic anhydrase